MNELTALRALIARHCAEGRRDTMIPRVSLMRASKTSTPLATVYEPRLSIVVQGAKQAEIGGRIIEYNPSRYLLVAVDLPVCSAVSRASVSEPFLAFTLKLDAALLAAMLSAADADAPPSPACGIRTGPLEDSLLDPVLRLVRLLDTPDDIAALAPLIEREILYRLLSGGQREALRQIAQTNSRTGQIGRAIAWLRRHYAQPFRIAELAELANMSPASLHRHFKAVTALSPLQYQKRIRLLEARRLLLARRDNASSISYAVGYQSPSQFSREYRRLFGAPPREDLHRLRGEGRPKRQRQPA